jgi:hypothetical protein
LCPDVEFWIAAPPNCWRSIFNCPVSLNNTCWPRRPWKERRRTIQQE